MPSILEAQTRWQATRSHCTSLEELQRAVKNNSSSSPCLSGCRSVCWKTFLLFQDTDINVWTQVTKDSREKYAERREHFLKFIEHPEALAQLSIDPLADDPDSPWNTVRQDETIRAEIQQDVQRLPEEANYHDERIQRMILDALFIYCKSHPERGGYRQGMHELLAPIVYVVEQDALDRSKAGDASPDEAMLEMLDSKYIEHDAYALFAKLMDHAQEFYEIRESSVSADSSSGRLQEQTSSIVERSMHIHQVCLNKIDPDLAVHLTNIEILPQIFLIRWVRLLFSREFPFSQFLILWDTMFAIDASLSLIDLICCAMLLRIRWQLLEADYSVCLQLLLKYPAPDATHGPHTFVDDALYLRDHLSATGGSTLVTKYTDRAPAPPGSITPGRTVANTGRAKTRPRPPVQSPAKLLQQQQAGVEAFLQGAAKGAKGVLERSERLGINQAVRDAMGELKRNMQNFNDARAATISGRQVATEDGAKAIAILDARNKHLASFLDETITNLKAVASSGLEDKVKSLELIEVAAAKVQFVQVYLQDSSMEVPQFDTLDSQQTDESTESPTKSTKTAAAEQTPVPVKTASAPKLQPELKSPAVKQSQQPKSDKPPATPAKDLPKTTKSQTATAAAKQTSTAPSREASDPLKSSDANTTVPETEAHKLERPGPQPTAVPTRSTIAQSSFSWMLEPEEPSSPKSPSSAAKSPTMSQHKKRISNNRNAFLFGDPADEEEGSGTFASEGIFGMETMSKSKAK